jgi:hypothetical protein
MLLSGAMHAHISNRYFQSKHIAEIQAPPSHHSGGATNFSFVNSLIFPESSISQVIKGVPFDANNRVFVSYVGEHPTIPSNKMSTGVDNFTQVAGSVAHFAGKQVVAKTLELQNSTENAFRAIRDSGEVAITLERTGTGATTGQLTCVSNTLTLQTTTDNNLVIGRNGSARITVNSSTINIPSLPTSASGLAAGDLWNDSGTLKIA